METQEISIDEKIDIVISRLEKQQENIKKGESSIDDFLFELGSSFSSLGAKSLHNRAVGLLEESLEEIEDCFDNENQFSVEDAVDVCFDRAYSDGSLTYNTRLAELELFSTCSLGALLEKQQEFSQPLGTEEMHIEMVKDKLSEILSKEKQTVNSFSLEAEEVAMLAVYNTLTKNGVSLNGRSKDWFNDLKEKELGLDQKQPTKLSHLSKPFQIKRKKGLGI